ncbi:class I SAM-dependent methyltransferase [Brachybacterium halotolerans subsp. kimchii]|uniref:class I SAM-dependent methyltransferase n=1 Tax=Brachybacterium halotolerans TaxID=2795215 RepID=UPI001E320379|nr:class I SAM-dependent methyltransferase [Brachybacterium halotolerans]UEJ83012.1 class I SAM-dependent methyltransferase [Brachybacterium halotolerans subsp. kimchii]
MSEQGTREAYAARAEEYAQVLGSVEQMSGTDRRHIEDWARRMRAGTTADEAGIVDDGGGGLILDLGCGPGHWTAHLAAQGHHMLGIDPVPAFVDRARTVHPGVEYRLGDVLAPGVEDDSCAGVLAWYCLIHLPPERMQEALASIGRVLRPGGALLLGFFDGPRIEPFDHAITTAHFWPVAELERLLTEVGFTVSAVEQRTDPGARPHGSIGARWGLLA